jgi:hypothetical protein
MLSNIINLKPLIRLVWDSSEFKDVYYPRISIGINRRGCSGYGGLEKIKG